MKKQKISFHSVDKFSLDNESAIEVFINTLAKEESRKVGDIAFVFCDDTYLHKINLEFMDHDTYTDVVTFDYSVGNELISEIYISTERVKENAKKYRETFENEIRRVMIHGVLHLCGYKDKLTEDKRIMRDKENHYLSLLALTLKG